MLNGKIAFFLLDKHICLDVLIKGWGEKQPACSYQGLRPELVMCFLLGGLGVA